MDGESIVWVRDEAERLSPAMRVAAFMRIARVLTASDRGAARELFDRALNEARSVPGREGESLLEDARMYAAAVAPERVSEFPIGKYGPKRFFSERAGEIMIGHGHVDAALQFVLHHEYGSGFPFGLAHQLIGKTDGEQPMAILRRAIEAWRAERGNDFLRRDGFIHLFRLEWGRLPKSEAQVVTREIVRAVLDAPDQPIHAGYGDEPKFEITSRREHVLFEILNVLRAIEPELAETLIAEHAQLAVAARRWPKGLTSIREEAELRRKKRENDSHKSGGFLMFGNPDSFPWLHALRKAEENGDFRPTLAYPLENFIEDMAPKNRNLALKASWPSTCMFCTVLYKAGKSVGSTAAAYLEEIPDPDQRLLARIELAAAIAGLPEFQQTQRGYFPKRSLQQGGG